MLFYLFGAPLLAVLEVIIYAGAIMVLFLFIVMMLKVETVSEQLFPLRQWLPAAVCGMIYLTLGICIVIADPNTLKVQWYRGDQIGNFLTGGPEGVTPSESLA